MSISEQQLLERIRAGKLIENASQMSPRYLEGMKRILTVSADTELISAPAYYLAAKTPPSTNAYLSAMSIIQDELGHAHIAYRLLEDLGVNKEQLIYKRKPEAFKYPYAFDVPLHTWTELAVANAMYDRAGFTLLGDVYQHTSFGPWKRALAKVDKEENFHLRHRRNLDAQDQRTAGRPRGTATGRGLDVPVDDGMVRSARYVKKTYGANRIRLQGQHQRRTAPDLDAHRHPFLAVVTPGRTRALGQRPGAVCIRFSLPGALHGR